MNKKIIIVTIIATALICFLNFNYENNKFSSLKFKNAEALAKEYVVKYTCWEEMSGLGDNNPTHITYCGDCLPHLARTYSHQSYCGTIHYE